MKLVTPESLRVEGMGIDTFQIANQAAKKLWLKKAWSYIEKPPLPLARQIPHRNRAARAPWVERDGARERGREATDWTGRHENLALPKSCPNGQERAPISQNLCDQWPPAASCSQISRNKHGKQYNIQILFCGVQNNCPNFTLISFCRNIPWEQSVLCFHTAYRALNISNLPSSPAWVLWPAPLLWGLFCLFPFNLQWCFRTMVQINKQ